MKFFEAYSKTIGKEAEAPKQETKTGESVTVDNVKQYFETMKEQLKKELKEEMEKEKLHKDVIVTTDNTSDEVIEKPEENTKTIIKEGD